MKCRNRLLGKVRAKNANVLVGIGKRGLFWKRGCFKSVHSLENLEKFSDSAQWAIRDLKPSRVGERQFGRHFRRQFGRR